MRGDRTKLVLCLFSLINLQFALCSYEIPKVKIEILKPKGFRASIPDSAGLKSFAFNGNVNKAINQNGVGQIGQEVLEAKEGRWVVEDPDVQLKDGDIIKYWVFVTSDNLGYVKDGLSFKVGGSTTEEIISNPTKPPGAKKCEPSHTVVRGSPACKGEVVFQETFDGPTLQESIWLVKHEIPANHLDLPFVSYQKSAVSVKNGNLVIQPVPQQNMPGFNLESDTLDLNPGCTGTSCHVTAFGFDVLPPVVTGHVKSIGFTFKYGRVDIRAKLPQGDWLYPEILLEPVWNKYGAANYSSGLMKIAKARGNLGFNDVLEGSLVLSNECPNSLSYSKTLNNGKKWGDSYHNYTVVWTPDYIKFLVDNEEARIFAPTDAGLPKLITDKECHDVSKANKSKMAPFDEDFVISLGVLAGGRSEFPDAPTKPWNNKELKAKLHFWRALDQWRPTWSGNSALQVDSVTVIAL